MNTNETSEPANYVHTNTPNIVRQTIGASHGNEQAHFGSPSHGAGHAINSMNVPWNASHLKS